MNFFERPQSRRFDYEGDPRRQDTEHSDPIVRVAVLLWKVLRAVVLFPVQLFVKLAALTYLSLMFWAIGVWIWISASKGGVIGWMYVFFIACAFYEHCIAHPRRIARMKKAQDENNEL